MFGKFGSKFFKRATADPSAKSHDNFKTSIKRVPYLPIEIIEQILLETPALTVLTSCRQVSKTWKSLIETSPKLDYYSRTGLKVPKDGTDINICNSQPQITPMAIIVISKFWSQIAKHGFISDPQPTISDPNSFTSKLKSRLSSLNPAKTKFARSVHSSFSKSCSTIYTCIYLTAGGSADDEYSERSPRWKTCLMVFLIVLTCPITIITSFVNYYTRKLIRTSPFKPVNRHRSKVKSEAARLLTQFSSIMNKVPFTTHQSGDKALTADIHARTNWGVITDYFGPILSKTEKDRLPAMYYNLALLLTTSVFFYIPKEIVPIPLEMFEGEYSAGRKLVQPTDAVVLVDFDYYRYGEGKGNQRMVFRGRRPFDVQWAEEGEYVGMQYLGHCYRVSV